MNHDQVLRYQVIVLTSSCTFSIILVDINMLLTVQSCWFLHELTNIYEVYLIDR